MSKTPQKPPHDGKKAALEDALRANLLKRKQQQRARDTASTPTTRKDEK